jgi:LuxR family transcriptional regulator, maltose regulon positive regulatory protein
VIGVSALYELLPGVAISRITPPTVPPQFVLRTKLLELLEKPAPHAAFAIAPSGFGKTILAAQWAAMHPDRTIWYTPSLTDTFKDLVFHCVASLRRFKPDAAPWIEKYRTEKFDPRAAVIEFANEIATIGFEVHFIADGSHNINPNNEEFTQLWAELMPENLKSFYLRNNLPPINYSKAISLDAVSILKPIDLAFTPNEIEILCANYGVEFEQNEKMISTVQNWPAGVLMTIKNIGKNGNFFDAEYTDNKMLVEATLRNLEPNTYQILEKLVYFNNLSKNQVAKILKTQSQLQSFLRLVNEGIFVLPVGSEANTFAINEIIRSSIIERLKLDPEKERKIRQETVEAKIASGNLEGAIEQLEEIGDHKRAKELAGLYVRRLLWEENPEQMLKGIDLISNYLDAGLSGKEVIDAYVTMAGGTLEELTLKIKGLEVTSQSNGTKEKIEADLIILKCRLAIGLGQLTKVIDLNKSAPKSSKTLFSLRMAANAAFLLEEYDILVEIADEARTLPLPDPSEATLHMPAIETLLALAEGRMLEALDLARYVIEETKKVGATGVWVAYDMAYCAAEVLREIGEENQAITMIESHMTDVKKFHVTSWQVALDTKHAMIEAQLGRSTAGLHRIRKIRDNLNSSKYSLEIFRVVDEHELIIRSLLEDYERMAELVNRTTKTATISIIGAALELRKGGEAAKLAISSIPTRNPREVLLFHILHINLYLDKPKLAESHLQKALPIIMSYGYRQILLIQSARFLEFLLKFAATYPTVYMEQISKEVRARMAKSNSRNEKIENPLTKREIEILNRLSTGIPISQIATNLHISHNTIKTHLKNVYKKLGAESREDAVQKGRELLLF